MKQQVSVKKEKVRSNRKDFFFALFTDSHGVYIKSVNNSLRDKKINPDQYSGNLKIVVNLYNQIKIKSRLIVDWDNPHSFIYLDRHPDLLELLSSVDNLIDSNGKAIYCSSTDFPVVLTIIQKNVLLQCDVTICDGKINRLVSEKYALVGNRLLSILPLGSGYKSLIDLNAIIETKELSSYLSIVFSNFTNIELKYLEYEVEITGECELLPSLVIESIDDSGFLTINTTFSYRDLITPEFYYKYKPVKLAIIDDPLGRIILSDLQLPDMDVLDSLIKMLYYIEEKYELSDSFNIDENGVIVHGELAHIMFSSELKQVLNSFSIYGDRFLRKNRLKKSHPNLELLLTSAIDYLQGSAHLRIYGENIPLYKAVSTYDNKGYIPLNDGSKGIIDSGYIEKIRRVIRETRDGVELSFFDLPYIENELEAAIKGDEFKSKLEAYRDDSQKVHELHINTDKLKGILRPYQLEGVRWMLHLHKIGVSGCLADDMGLGKTVQTLCFLLQVMDEADDRPILIVMPKSLIFNWGKELKKFTPHLKPYVYYGGTRDTIKISEHRLILTTYHTLRNDIEQIKKIPFFYTILDEIQNIKNHTSKLARACFLLNSQYKLGISGTPVENSLGDLYSISRFLNPTFFGSFRMFKEQWSGPIASDDSEIVTNILRRKIKPLFLRRMKEDVLDDLPPKSEQVIYVDMSEKQKSYYEGVRKDYHDKIRLKIRDEGIDKSQLSIIRAFMELRQIATIPEVKTKGIITSPKKELILEHILETLSGGHKVLIFSNFLAAIKGLSDSLNDEGIGHRVITGATGNRERIVEEFMDDCSVKALIMTLKTGGIGLNLTAASYVYIVDPWWNLASENQAIDRTHRIGQKSSVFCYRFIARGTIEEKILELQGKKKALFDNLFSKSEGGKNGFSNEDIDYLLG